MLVLLVSTALLDIPPALLLLIHVSFVQKAAMLVLGRALVLLVQLGKLLLVLALPPRLNVVVKPGGRTPVLVLLVPSVPVLPMRLRFALTPQLVLPLVWHVPLVLPT